MVEYIEREALLAFLEENHTDRDWLVNQYNADWICSWIESQPAADVAPVVHGEWFVLDECANEGVYCSVCHKKVYKVDYARSNKPVKMKSNYCPNCGADMRERKGDDAIH